MKFIDRVAHLVLPRHSNNHRAKILHSTILLLIAVKLLLLQYFLGVFIKSGHKVLGYAANISPTEVVRLTNEKRAEAGIAPVTQNTLLSQAAQAKGAHMLANDYWAHVAPDGTEPWKFFRDFGYNYRFAGENLARDFSDPVSVVNAWMASPTHRDNLLAGKYKEIGVAVVEGDLGGADTTIVVQLFGTQLADTVVAPVAAAETINKELALIESPQPTATPTPKPTPTPIAVENTVSLPQGRNFISPFTLTKAASAGIVGILFVLMIVDVVIISKKGVKRARGRSLAHIALFIMILAIILVAKAGQIL